LTGRGPQSEKNVSRETGLSDRSRKPYKASYARWLEMRKIARKLMLDTIIPADVASLLLVS
jgi:hypothetical protein